jgi:hypothetical protein
MRAAAKPDRTERCEIAAGRSGMVGMCLGSVDSEGRAAGQEPQGSCSERPVGRTVEPGGNVQRDADRGSRNALSVQIHLFFESPMAAVGTRHCLRGAQKVSWPGSTLDHLEGTFITESERSGLLRQLYTSRPSPRRAWTAEEAGKADLQGRAARREDSNRLDSSGSVKRTPLSRTVEKQSKRARDQNRGSRPSPRGAGKELDPVPYRRTTQKAASALQKRFSA